MSARVIDGIGNNLDDLVDKILHQRVAVRSLVRNSAEHGGADWQEQADNALRHLRLAADALETAAALLRGETAMTLAGDEHEDVSGLPRLAQADATTEAVL